MCYNIKYKEKKMATEKTTAKERVKKEREELSKKIEKLENLIGKVKTDNIPNHKKLLDSLSNEQKKLLKKQLRVMKEYRHILDRRLSIWVEEN